MRTPLVDVCLVLLIVQLPETAKTSQVTLKSDRTVYLDNRHPPR